MIFELTSTLICGFILVFSTVYFLESRKSTATRLIEHLTRQFEGCNDEGLIRLIAHLKKPETIRSLDEFFAEHGTEGKNIRLGNLMGFRFLQVITKDRDGVPHSIELGP